MVAESILFGFFRGEPAVPFTIHLNLIHFLAAVQGYSLSHQSLDISHLFSLDRYI